MSEGDLASAVWGKDRFRFGDGIFQRASKDHVEVGAMAKHTAEQFAQCAAGKGFVAQDYDHRMEIGVKFFLTVFGLLQGVCREVFVTANIKNPHNRMLDLIEQDV